MKLSVELYLIVAIFIKLQILCISVLQISIIRDSRPQPPLINTLETLPNNVKFNQCDCINVEE
jgi:hypothetical protein